MNSDSIDVLGKATNETKSLFQELGSSRLGLTSTEAMSRLVHQAGGQSSTTRIISNFIQQFTSPIQILLIVAAILSAFFGEVTDCVIISFILLASGLLSFVQEFRAGNAVAELMKLVETKCLVLRDGAKVEMTLDAIVKGDIAFLSAGSVIPGDGIVLEEDSLFVDQASLTGESFPVEKSTTSDGNQVFAGTNVVSGSAIMIVSSIGSETRIGGIAQSLKVKRPEGDFQKGVRQLGTMLIQLTIFLTIFVLMVNILARRPVLESFMFSLALAVGLTPQLLPAIVSLNLSRGALAMAKDNVIVKRLASIENFGSMNILCSDKTGTLTHGTVEVARAMDASGNDSARVLTLSQLNAIFESGYVNPIDEALRKGAPAQLAEKIEKLGETPYDFQRKRLSVLIREGESGTLITKGALASVLGCCTNARLLNEQVEIGPLVAQIEANFKKYSDQGFRVLGVSSLDMPLGTVLDSSHEQGMTFEGMLLLHDPLREESAATISKLNEIGIELKMITGDNRHVAAFIGTNLGLQKGQVTGSELDLLSDEALLVRAREVSIFSEIEPRQKQRIVLSLKRGGAVVGYIGDGINDAPALHASDVSISVANAVDVAKEAADFVMLKPDISVLVGAVLEGRRTFSNTMKYIFMATSANFGNMFSLAGASLLIPFLPLLAKQVLLTNLLTDFPEMTIAGDNVDSEVLQSRQQWDLLFLRKFMLVFGLLSSVFDFATFGVLIWLKTTPEVFRTAWFTESVISASLIVLVFRSRRWLWQSRPSNPLIVTTLATCIAVLALPWTPIAKLIGFQQLPISLLCGLLGIVATYLISAEVAKHWFFRAQATKKR
ncbi:MAG: magnesium-translocating P-type ATPase [Armatimonadota bacterium]